MNEPIRNPYDPHRPTADPALFFGRDDVFAFIRQQLIAARRAQAMGIIGQRGMGKTSVLLQIAYQIEPRYLTAYIDLADVRFDEVGGLFAAMADAARLALDSAGLSTYRLPPIPEEPGVDLWQWFSETYLDVTLSALRRSRRLLFLFDETSRLLDAIDRQDVPEGFDATLGQLIARDERMDIIFAIDAEDEHRLETFGPLSDPLLHKRIGLLDDAAAESLIRRPVAPFYEVQPDAVEGILAMAGGHPYLLHVINGLVWERVMGRRPRGSVTLHDVQAVIRQATDEADPVLRLTWTRSTPNERHALSALTALTTASRGMPVRAEDARLWLLRESDEPLDETALAAALRRLEYRDVLRSTANGMYTFTTGLQHQWLVLNGDVQPVSTVVVPQRPSARRLAIPVALLLGLAVVLALALARLVTSQATPLASDGQASPTVTLDLDIVATNKALEATQTFQAIPTITPTTTSTPTATATATATMTATPTLTLTLTPSLAATTPGQTDTQVFTLTVTSTQVATLTGTMTASAVPSNTRTRTPGVTATHTPTSTMTLTMTLSPTPVPSSTKTATATVTAMPLPTETPTPPLSITPPPFPTAQLRATP
jgi:hypothetical protein